MAFNLFGSKKRKEAENEKLRNEILDGVKALINAGAATEEDVSEIMSGNPLKKAILSNSTLTVILHDGTRLVDNDATKEIYELVVSAKSEDVVKKLMMAPFTKYDVEQQRIVDRVEEERLAKIAHYEAKVAEYERKKSQAERYTQLIDHQDFEARNGSLYLKGVDLSIPNIVVEGFLDAMDKPGAFSALKNFWYWLALNPNEESRNDLFRFIEHNDVKITANGLLVLYRGICSRNQESPNKALIEFVSTQYAKIKMAKKGPGNYAVYITADGYKIWKSAEEKDADIVGNLKDLYNSLGSLQETGVAYTDAHTRTMDIKIGSVYSIAEEEVDRNNSIECSTGLHVGSKSFGIGSFGDTKVMALVNPMKVRAVPAYDSQKMRVSEMFIVGVLELDDEGDYMDAEYDVVSMDDEYFNIGVEELEEMAKSVNIKELSAHQLLPAVSMPALEFITETLVEKNEEKKSAKEQIQNRVKTVTY